MKEKITVLIADDNKDFSRTLATYLSNEEDMEIIGIAKDGLEAVEIIKKEDVAKIQNIVSRELGTEIKHIHITEK